MRSGREQRAALEYARSQGWAPPERVAELDRLVREFVPPFANPDSDEYDDRSFDGHDDSFDCELEQDPVIVQLQAQLAEAEQEAAKLRGQVVELQSALAQPVLPSLQAQIAELEKRLAQRAPHLRKRIAELEDALRSALDPHANDDALAAARGILEG